MGWAWPTGGPEEPVPDRVPALHHDPVGARGALRHGRQGFQHVLVPVDGGPPPASLHGGTTTILPSFTGFHMFFLFCFFWGFHSTTSKWKSTARRWRRCCSRRTSTPTFSTRSDSSRRCAVDTTTCCPFFFFLFFLFANYPPTISAFSAPLHREFAVPFSIRIIKIHGNLSEIT